jgi:hypothetical protein
MPLRNFGLSFFRRGARPNPGGSWRPRHAVGAGLVVLLVALWTALVHAGAAEDKLLAQRIIAESWPELVSACRLGLTLQPQPERDTPLDGALRARCLNGAKFYIKLTSPAHSVWKGGPTVFRCDGAYMRDAMKCRGWWGGSLADSSGRPNRYKLGGRFGFAVVLALALIIVAITTWAASGDVSRRITVRCTVDE